MEKNTRPKPWANEWLRSHFLQLQQRSLHDAVALITWRSPIRRRLLRVWTSNYHRRIRNMFQNHAFPEISFIFPNESSKENSSFPEFYLGKTGHSAHCCTKIAVANEPSVNQKNRQKITTIRRLQTIAFLVLMVQEGRWSVYDSPNHSLRSLPTATKYIKCQLAQARQRDKIQWTSETWFNQPGVAPVVRSHLSR